MANRFLVKRSAVTANVPTTSQLELGEIAINTYDGKLFIKKDNGTASVVEIGGNTGTVTSVSIVSANGVSGTVATSTTTPAITLTLTKTGTGSTYVVDTSPTLVTPNLGTPTSLVGTNITGTATSFTASNVTTNANLTGEVTSTGNATTLTNSAVIGKVLTGYVSGAGVLSATDSILQAVQKLNGNIAAAGGGAALSNDTTTATSVFPLFAATTTGTPTTIFTSNAKYLYKPSTGELRVTAPMASNGLVLNANVVSTSYTIASGFNACSVGPMTVSSGIAVTISAGQRWVVL